MKSYFSLQDDRSGILFRSLVSLLGPRTHRFFQSLRVRTTKDKMSSEPKERFAQDISTSCSFLFLSFRRILLSFEHARIYESHVFDRNETKARYRSTISSTPSRSEARNVFPNVDPNDPSRNGIHVPKQQREEEVSRTDRVPKRASKGSSTARLRSSREREFLLASDVALETPPSRNESPF